MDEKQIQVLDPERSKRRRGDAQRRVVPKLRLRYLRGQEELRPRDCALLDRDACQPLGGMLAVAVVRLAHRTKQFKTASVRSVCVL